MFIKSESVSIFGNIKSVQCILLSNITFLVFFSGRNTHKSMEYSIRMGHYIWSELQAYDQQCDHCEEQQGSLGLEAYSNRSVNPHSDRTK